jgi:hypothetical protein
MFPSRLRENNFSVHKRVRRAMAARMVVLEIRKRPTRVQVLQNNLNRLLGLIEDAW